ncbi:MAG: SxtJ family membrane protein [Burkholderiales bacterium]
MDAPPRTPRELRKFGAVLAVAFPAVFCLLLPWLFARPVPWWPLAVSAVLLALAAVAPAALAPVERAWLRVGHVLGWVNTRILLAVLFFVLVLPLGLLLRLLRKLPIARRFDPDAASYRVPSTRDDDPKSMEKPF